jgi:hypothetical protein
VVNSLTLSGCSVLGNDVTGNNQNEGFGGGLAILNSTTITINQNTTIIGNDATQYGGGIYIFDEYNVTTLTMNGGQLNGNTAGVYGGGFFINAASDTITLTSVSDTKNSAGAQGGGGFLWAGTLAGSLSQLTGNSDSGGVNGNTAGIAVLAGATATITVPPNQQTITDILEP